VARSRGGRRGRANHPVSGQPASGRPLRWAKRATRLVSAALPVRPGDLQRQLTNAAPMKLPTKLTLWATRPFPFTLHWAGDRNTYELPDMPQKRKE
jgi:hypothetical protein